MFSKLAAALILAVLIPSLPAAAGAHGRVPTIRQAEHVIEAAEPYAELGACHRGSSAVTCNASEAWEFCPEATGCKRFAFHFTITVRWHGPRLTVSSTSASSEAPLD